jgi:hypothetical protein
VVRVVVKFIGSKNQSEESHGFVPLLTFQERLISIPDFSSDRVGLSLLFVCSNCLPLFVPFGLFFFWPLYCLSSYLRLCFLQIVQSHRSIASHEFRIGGALTMGDFQVVIRTD